MKYEVSQQLHLWDTYIGNKLIVQIIGVSRSSEYMALYNSEMDSFVTVKFDYYYKNWCYDCCTGTAYRILEVI